MLIPFNLPHLTGKEAHFMYQAVYNGKLSGNGEFTKRCQRFFEEKYDFKKCLLTTSCTDALEMAAILCDIKPGDEVIVPSYTFVSSALAFVRQGAKIVFADSMKRNPNIDAKQLEALITSRTKVIVPVHYAGVACDMDCIMEIAERHKLLVVEDAAQGVMSTYRNKSLGTIGDFGCFSFHETKNFSMGEGGAILIREQRDVERAEILREKGTNRSQFFRGQVAKYNWIDYGSSYLPSDLNAAYLWAQLQHADEMLSDRMASWNKYHEALKPLEDKGIISLPVIPQYCEHNAHMFYIKCSDLEVRTSFIGYMRENDILAVFHYVPLHSAPAGQKFGRFCGKDEYTTKESDRLVRLPLYYKLSKQDQEKVIDRTLHFFNTL